MQIKFSEFKIEDKSELVSFLTSERWEFHGQAQITPDKVVEQLNSGHFTGTDKKSFWILNYNGEKIGLIKLFDLGEKQDSTETPLFDIRIKKGFRNKGVGKETVRWLTEYVFTNYPNKNRFEATTRYDNKVMRKVLEECGFVKEAHYRLAWPDEHGTRYDCIGYAILRSDWKNKTKTPVKFNQ